jgi:o-succinylbenzoate---CoA ligase
VRALLAGTTPYAVDNSDGFRPERFAEAARHTLAAVGPRYTALVPTQLARLLDDNDKGLGALREFDAVLLGGAATPPHLVRRALDAGVRAITTYGMSETSGGCVYDGTPLPGAEVHVAGAESDVSPSTISLAGPMLARGYRRAPEDSRAFADGWFRTGDLGQWREGRLEVLGRADDMIITGGVNVAPAPVERILVECEGVREACVLGVDDPEWGQVVVAVVLPDDSGSPPSTDALRSAVRERMGAASAPKRIVFLAELPLRGPGKPDRRALREAWKGETGP